MEFISKSHKSACKSVYFRRQPDTELFYNSINGHSIIDSIIERSVSFFWIDFGPSGCLKRYHNACFNV